MNTRTLMLTERLLPRFTVILEGQGSKKVAQLLDPSGDDSHLVCAYKLWMARVLSANLDVEYTLGEIAPIVDELIYSMPDRGACEEAFMGLADRIDAVQIEEQAIA